MTPHFSDAELACPCGCGMLPKAEFMDMVEGVRVPYGEPLIVSSAARCAKYNDELYQRMGEPAGTHLDGPHVERVAIDFAIYGEKAHKLLRVAARHANFAGIGIHQKGPHNKRLLHLDTAKATPTRPRPFIWTY